MTHSNPMVLRRIYCQLLTDQDTLQRDSNDTGRITFDQEKPETIALIHGCWPDRFSVFEVSNPADNYYEFNTLPSIVEVEFNNLALKIEDERANQGGSLRLSGCFLSQLMDKLSPKKIKAV